jgi:hypothetical protein
MGRTGVAQSSGSQTDSAGGPASPGTKTGAWIAVLLIVVAFILGVVALIAKNNVAVWIAAGVVLVIGGILALASRIMELGH